MADDEQFSLCWNNFNSNLSAGFHESLCRGDLVDVTLAAEGQLVKAHRLVLSVCSPYFRKMFTQMPANQHAFVFLKDVSHTALKDLIQFMYCGEVNVKQEALPAFISTAEALQIKGLTDSDPPASQSPAEPSTPQPQMQQISSPRVRQRTTTSRATYKIDALDDNGDKIQQQPTQIVIQTTSAPQQTTISQQHIQTLQQQHVAAPSLATTTGGTTTATVVTHKRPAQRSLSGASSAPHKRTKSTIDPLEVTEMTTSGGAGTSSANQQQQITVQTTVVPSSSIAEAKAQAAAAAASASDTEYIDLPIEMPTKAEPDYADEAGEVEAADNDGAGYVEDDSYGEMRYDESYFTENDDGPTTVTATVSSGAATSGVNTATTSKAVVKQQAASFSDSYVEAGDQSNNDAQVELLRKRRGRPKGSRQRSVQLTLEEKFKAITENTIGTPAVYASTTKGGMKILYEGHHFRYSYRKGQYSIFQCCYKENKEECKVKVLSDQKRIYPLEGEHVHFVQATDKSVTDVTFEPAALQDEQDVTYIEMPIVEQQSLSIKMPENNAPNTENYEIYETAYLKTLQENETNDETDDANDFREKIKQRLQKALMAKKK